MENSGSKEGKVEESKKNFNPNEIINNSYINIGELFKKNEAKDNTNRIKECLINMSNTSVAFEKIAPHISNVSKSICKIKINLPQKTKFGTGFLLRFMINQEMFYCLISNEHVISNEIIKNNNTILIAFDSEFKKAVIKLDSNKRYIKSFINNNLDITAVQILDEDNISRDYFLYPEIEERINDDYLINSKIYIPQYPKGRELKYARGIIKEIDKYEFTHLANTESGSSGSPIFLEGTINVIGIHKEACKIKNENYADFIYPVINIIKEDIIKKSNNGRYLNGRYTWDDGKYYEGQFKNDLPNGKGVKYYSNGNILYEGYFLNGKFDGKGKYIYDNGDYFIGQYKNGLRTGKGKLYYRNGNIMYEGDFINNKRDGFGKYIYEDGKYYIGQWKNDLFHGKGTQYYPNGNIFYEGDFVNDKREGFGKYIYEDGKYYIGQWKNDLFHGKGTEYYPNGNIMYEGDFVNDKREGFGKFINEDGKYYIGQWKNDLLHGKGTLYYSNGNIIYEGDFVNDKRDGYGKCIYVSGEYYIGQWKNGFRNGKGIIYFSNGIIMYDGFFINDVFVGN